MNSSKQTTPFETETPDSTATTEVNQIVMLHDGYTVSKTFFDGVRLQVQEALPLLVRDKKYTSKKLCSKEFWKAMDNGERRMAGRCIAHSVARKFFPLSFAEFKHEYPKYYQLT